VGAGFAEYIGTPDPYCAEPGAGPFAAEVREREIAARKTPGRGRGFSESSCMDDQRVGAPAQRLSGHRSLSERLDAFGANLFQAQALELDELGVGGNVEFARIAQT
jgi:hypothetical protein